jgi:hypothetical protein
MDYCGIVGSSSDCDNGDGGKEKPQLVKERPGNGGWKNGITVYWMETQGYYLVFVLRNVWKKNWCKGKEGKITQRRLMWVLVEGEK